MKRKLKLVTALKRIAEVRVIDEEWDKEARRAARRARKDGKKSKELELRLRQAPKPPKVREPESPLFDGVQIKYGQLDQLLRS